MRAERKPARWVEPQVRALSPLPVSSPPGLVTHLTGTLRGYLTTVGGVSWVLG